MNQRTKGIVAALSSAIFLGLTPIFGKQSILFGFSPFAVVAIRTTLATALFLIFLLLFKRSFLYIYSLGLVGCLLAGFINGLGSILFYTGLSRIDAGIGQLLYSFYPLFVAFWLFIDRQSISKVTLLRLILSLPGIFLLLSNSEQKIDMVGAAMMFGAAFLYALHLLINQRVLFEVPAPTVTFYTLLGMSITVLIAFWNLQTFSTISRYTLVAIHCSWNNHIPCAVYVVLWREAIGRNANLFTWSWRINNHPDCSSVFLTRKSLSQPMDWCIVNWIKSCAGCL